jgi:hypothetical protein
MTYELHRNGRDASSALAGVLFRVLVDCIGELAQVGIQGGKQPSEGVPAHIESPCLGVRDVSLARACASRDLLLREPGFDAQCAERSSKDEPVFVGVGHVGGRSIVWKSQIGTCQVRRVRLVCRQHKIVAPALLEQPGAVAPRVQASRCAGHATNVWIVASSPRADLTAPPTKEEPKMTTITIPARIVRVLRESLHSQLGMAAEDIGQASHDGGRRCPHLYAEPVERFDRTRALLDLVGWKETEGDGPATINLATHRLAVLMALEGQMWVERNMMEEDPTLEGAAKQIRSARRRAQEIELFLTVAGATLSGRG